MGNPVVWWTFTAFAVLIIGLFTIAHNSNKWDTNPGWYGGYTVIIFIFWFFGTLFIRVT